MSSIEESRTVAFRGIGRALALCAALLGCFAGSILAATLAQAQFQAAPATTRMTTPPHLWEPQQLPKADLSQIARIRFLTTTDFFPLNSIDARGNLVGYHVDLAREICRELQIADRCQIQAMPFDELADALVKGDGEVIIAGLEINEQNRERYHFSRPFLRFPARFMTLREHAIKEPLYVNLEYKRVGVLQGSAHEAVLAQLFPNIHIIPAASPSAQFEALQKGDVVAIFGDGMRFSFDHFGKEAGGCCSFTGGPYYAPSYLGQGLAIAVRKDLRDLANGFDYALQRLETSGVLNDLYLRHFPVGFN